MGEQLQWLKCFQHLTSLSHPQRHTHIGSCEGCFLITEPLVLKFWAWLCSHFAHSFAIVQIVLLHSYPVTLFVLNFKHTRTHRHSNLLLLLSHPHPHPRVPLIFLTNALLDSICQGQAGMQFAKLPSNIQHSTSNIQHSATNKRLLPRFFLGFGSSKCNSFLALDQRLKWTSSANELSSLSLFLLASPSLESSGITDVN